MSTSNIARRIALLSTSSLGLAAIASAASLGLTLTPTAALAANECGNPATNGTTADTFTCPVATYPTGIQHTSNGDLSVTVQTGTSPTLSNFGTGGVVSTAGTVDDDLTLRLTGSGTASSYSFNTAFPALLNAESQAGDVTVELKVDQTAQASNAPTVSANNAATTRAIRAVSSAGGDVTVRNLSVTSDVLGSGELIRRGVIQSNVNTGAVAIEARSVGGGDVTVDLGYGRAVGRLYGILAQVDGSGAVNILGAGQANTSLAGSAGVRVLAGTGPVVVGTAPYINGARSSEAFTGRTGVYVNAGGDITFSGVAQGTDYGVDIVNVAAGTTTTINLQGRQVNAVNSMSQTTGGLAAVRAKGAGALLVNFTGAQSNMNFDFSGMTGPVEVTVKDNGAWVVNPGVATAVVGSNYNKITIERGGFLMAPFSPGANYNGLEAPTVLNFAPGFVLDNAGTILVGPDDISNGSSPAVHEAEFRIVGLGEFHHSGTVMLGSTRKAALPGAKRFLWAPVNVGVSDGWYDDILVFEDGTWIGEGGKVIFDADINKTQTNCTREAVTNDFQAADCLRFVDATVEGQTYVSIAPIFGGDRGRLTQQISDEGIMLVEGTGTTVLVADNFALDPEMKGYNQGTLDMGLYQYALLFDEDANQFKLFGTLSSAAYQLPMAATAAHNLWRTSTGSWLNRQADLRGTLQEGLGGGIWMRASGERTDRDVTNASTLGGLPFSLDSSHRADTYAITGGVDILSGNDGHTGYVVGMLAGYAHADVEYAASANTQAMDAWTGGLYGGLVVGQLFVDAVVNANNVIIDTDAPGFNFLPEGTILSSRMISLGGQVEAGWRMLFDGGFFAEPLASVSYVRSKMEDLQIQPDDFSRPGLEVSFEDPSSFRAGAGGRVGLDRDFAVMRTQFSLLGRVWNDLEGQNTASIHNLAFPDDPDIRVTDDFAGMTSEVTLGASVWSPAGAVSGFFNLGGKFGDDYDAKTGSVGVRVAW